MLAMRPGSELVVLMRPEQAGAGSTRVHGTSGVSEACQRCCLNCGGTFATKKRVRRFCKDSCRYAYHNQSQAGLLARFERLEAKAAALEASVQNLLSLHSPDRA